MRPIGAGVGRYHHLLSFMESIHVAMHILVPPKYISLLQTIQVFTRRLIHNSAAAATRIIMSICLSFLVVLSAQTPSMNNDQVMTNMPSMGFIYRTTLLTSKV